ncbi:hypothetical protein J4573_52650, partial [Actinomadura barringtoniae]|nr:hypothetical protein [Actinomadura barringtoniae]
MTFPWLASLLLYDLATKTLRTRRRLRALPVLEAAGPPESEDWRVMSAQGVRVDADTRRAAVAHALRRRLELVDLVPGDLHTEGAIELFRYVDPAARVSRRRLRKNRALSAGHALVVDGGLARRAEVTGASGLDPVEFIQLTRLLRRHAPRTAGLAVAPRLAACPVDARWRKPCLRALEVPVPVAMLFQFTELAGFAGAIRVAPIWGLIPLLLFWLQPLLIFAGSHPIHPRDLPRATTLRPALRLYTWLRAITARRPTHNASQPPT